MERTAIPITVIGGYLGAGKTTLLNRLLAEPHGRRLGVIVNDFGSIGIDAELLADAAPDGVVNLPNGCVCCTLGQDLHDSLTTLRDADAPPDHIVIESSGVADPTTVAAWGTSAGFEPGGIVVLAAADSVRRQASDAYVGDEVRRQLAGADLLGITKTDLCTADEVSAVLHWLRRHTRAPLLDVGPAGDVPVEVLLGHRGASSPSPPEIHDALARYESWSLRLDGRVPRDALDAVLSALPDGLLRLKGFVVDDRQRTLVVNVVGPSRHIGVSNLDVPSTVISAIGVRGVVDFSALERSLRQIVDHPDANDVTP